MSGSVDTGVLPPEHTLSEWRDLCLFLRGDESSFTGHLLRLIAKADMRNRQRLRTGFPREVKAWELWQSSDDPGGLTACRLAEMLAEW